VASRRNFLNIFRKSLKTSKENSPLVVRPPYALTESLFQSECVTCEAKSCVASCDEQIIIIQTDGTPRLDFTKSVESRQPTYLRAHQCYISYLYRGLCCTSWCDMFFL